MESDPEPERQMKGRSAYLLLRAEEERLSSPTSFTKVRGDNISKWGKKSCTLPSGSCSPIVPFLPSANWT